MLRYVIFVCENKKLNFLHPHFTTMKNKQSYLIMETTITTKIETVKVWRLIIWLGHQRGFPRVSDWLCSGLILIFFKQVLVDILGYSGSFQFWQNISSTHLEKKSFAITINVFPVSRQIWTLYCCLGSLCHLCDTWFAVQTSGPIVDISL